MTHLNLYDTTLRMKTVNLFSELDRGKVRLISMNSLGNEMLQCMSREGMI